MVGGGGGGGGRAGGVCQLLVNVIIWIVSTVLLGVWYFLTYVLAQYKPTKLRLYLSSTVPQSIEHLYMRAFLSFRVHIYERHAKAEQGK